MSNKSIFYKRLIFPFMLLPMFVMGSSWRAIKAWLTNDYPYYEWLKEDLADCKEILELGCGSNSPMLHIGMGNKTDAIDVWEPYIDMHNNNNDYRTCRLLDILNLPANIRDKTYDAVVIYDVMEHLPREKVIEMDLFGIMENIARKKVIIFAPNGFVENDEVDGDPYQRHISAWEPNDYIKRGYKVDGSTGLRWLMGKASLPKYNPGWLFQILILFTQPLVFNYPNIAWHSYAVKEVK